jgi:hypothetical protein
MLYPTSLIGTVSSHFNEAVFGSKGFDLTISIPAGRGGSSGCNKKPQFNSGKGSGTPPNSFSTRKATSPPTPKSEDALGAPRIINLFVTGIFGLTTTLTVLLPTIPAPLL